MELTIKLGVDGDLFMMDPAMKRIIYHVLGIVEYFNRVSFALNYHLLGKTNYIAIDNI